MLLYSVLAFMVTVAIVLDTVIRKADFFAPARLYLFFHSTTIGIAFLGFHKAMVPFKPFTTLVYLGSGFAFLLGALVPTLVAGRIRKSPPNLSGYNWRLHWTFSFLLFAFFLTGMLVAYQGSGAFPLLAKKKQAAIYAFNHVALYSNVAYNMGAVSAVMFFIAILRPQRIPPWLRPGVWMAFITLMIFFLAMNRSGALLTIFSGLTLINYGLRRLSIVHLFAFIALFMGLFIPFSYSRLDEPQKKILAKLDPMMVTGLLLKIPYVYISNNYWNLDYALNPENYQTRHPTTYGFTTFSGILDLAYLPGGGMLGTEIRESGGFEDMFHKHTVKIKGLNTVTYQWGLYKDFGLAGVLIVPFFVGIFIGIFHRRMREEPDVFNIAVYSYFAFFIAFNWFTAMWELLNFSYGCIFVATACYLCRKLAAPPVTETGGRLALARPPGDSLT